MRIVDPHIHMTSRTTDDHEALYAAFLGWEPFLRGGE